MRESNGGVVRLAGWCATHRAMAVVGWVLVVALGVGLGAVLGANQGGGQAFYVGEAGRAERMADDAGLGTRAVEQVLIGPGDAGETDRAVAELRTGLAATPGIATVRPTRRAPDGSALVSAEIAGPERDASGALPAVDAASDAVARAHPTLPVERTGSATLSQANADALGAGLARAEAITLPVTLVILVLVFGALLLAAVPLALGITSFLTAMGLYSVASLVFPDAGGAVANVVAMLGMALGVDYSLFFVKRLREERLRTGDPTDHGAAVRAAAATAGRTVVVSGTAVAVALVGLYLADDVIFSSVATGSILVVVVAVTGALTVLPALLATLGPRVDRRAVRRRSGGTSHGSRWDALLAPALRRPRATVVLACAGMLLLAAPVLGATLRVEGKDTYPRGIPAVAVYDRMVATFPDAGVTHRVVVHTDADHVAATRDALGELARRASADPDVVLPVLPVLTPGAPRPAGSADGTTQILELPVRGHTNDPPAASSLAALRGEWLPATVGRVPGTDWAVTGDAARSLDYADHQAAHAPWVIAFAALATGAVMVLAFGSVAVGLLGIVLNALSALAALGVVVAVFQSTAAPWFEGLLGFSSVGFVSSRLPLFLFVLLFGLSTDYQVFVVGRIRELVRGGVPHARAVREGLVASAGPVTGAAAVMVSAFAALGFVDLVELKQLGVGLSVAVILDAVVVRVLVLPAALTLLGERTWWPATPPPGRTSGQPTSRSSRSSAPSLVSTSASRESSRD